MWVPKIQPVCVLWSNHHRRQHCPNTAYQHNLDGDLRCPALRSAICFLSKWQQLAIFSAHLMSAWHFPWALPLFHSVGASSHEASFLVPEGLMPSLSVWVPKWQPAFLLRQDLPKLTALVLGWLALILRFSSSLLCYCMQISWDNTAPNNPLGCQEWDFFLSGS